MKPFKSFLALQLKEFIAYRQSLGYAQRPVRQYLLLFDRYLIESKTTPGLLTPAFFLELKVNLNMQPTSVNKLLYAVRVFFKFLIRKGHYQKNPLEDIDPLPENAFIPFIFSPEQTDQLLDTVCKKIRKTPQFFLKDLGVHLAIVLLARCGMRISEPLSLLRSHYRRDEATLYIEKTKFKKDRLIPVPKAAIKEIDNYLAAREAFFGQSQNPYLLAGIKQRPISQQRVRSIFHQAVEDIGLDCPKQTIANMTFAHPTPHSLRHAFAVNTLKGIKQRGKSAQNALPILAAYMGHSEYRHTVKYLKVLDAEHRQHFADFARSYDENS
jgi:site-specific recombinase XerD